MVVKQLFWRLACYSGFLCLAFSTAQASDPADLVDITTLVPEVRVEGRYAGSDNFLGVVVDGYRAPRCLLTRPAAEALARVQARVAELDLVLVVYDCYRPQRAVDHFMRWARNDADQIRKDTYYPNVDKARLIPDGYIAERSGHSRGSTVDLSLAEVGGEVLDMGTPWDYFDPLSATDHPAISDAARANRLLLRNVMGLEGFGNYPAEWWHYTLAGEPLPDTYLDLPVE